jgi:hypothetical protein
MASTSGLRPTLCPPSTPCRAGQAAEAGAKGTRPRHAPPERGAGLGLREAHLHQLLHLRVHACMHACVWLCGCVCGCVCGGGTVCVSQSGRLLLAPPHPTSSPHCFHTHLWRRAALRPTGPTAAAASTDRPRRRRGRRCGRARLHRALWPRARRPGARARLRGRLRPAWPCCAARCRAVRLRPGGRLDGRAAHARPRPVHLGG